MPPGSPQEFRFPHRRLVERDGEPVTLSGRAPRLALAALLIFAPAAAVWWMVSRVVPPPTRVIAVLPFRVLNSDAANEHLGLGLTAALITRLGNFSQIAVRPLSTVAKVAAKDPLEAGKAVGAETVIEGNVETDGDRVRLNVHMLRVRDGAFLWAEHFDESASNLFTLEDSISARAAAGVSRHLPPGRETALAKRSTRNGEAYASYLRGRYWASRYTQEGLRKGLGYLQAAVDSDPGYALAYSGLADTYYDASNLLLPPIEAMPKAKAAAQRAVSLDPTLAEAHVSLGLVASKYDWNWPEADKEFQAALALDPNAAAAHQWYGLYRAQLGDMDRALAGLRRAQELDPLSSDIGSYLSTVMYWARKYEDSVAQARKTTDFDPNFVPAFVTTCWALDAEGRAQDALKSCLRANSLDPSPWTSLALSRAQALAGDRLAAQTTLDAVRKLAGPGFVSGYDVAAVHAAMGQTDQAFAALEDAYQHRAEWLSYLKVDPQMDPLRRDQRFVILLQKMRLY